MGGGIFYSKKHNLVKATWPLDGVSCSVRRRTISANQREVLESAVSALVSSIASALALASA